MQSIISVATEPRRFSVARVAGLITGPGFYRIVLASAVFLTHMTALKLGQTAVVLFFSLSGYWLYVLWTKTYSKTRAPILTYVASRALRLMPLYLLLFPAVLFLSWYFGQLSPFPPDILHRVIYAVSNVVILGLAHTPHAYIILGNAWSLDIEIQFYIAIPFIVFALVKFPRATMIGLLGAIAASLIFILSPLGMALPYQYLPTYFVFFGAGLMCAHYKLRPPNWLVWPSAIVAVALLIACLLFRDIRAVFVVRIDPVMYAYNLWANNLLAILLLPVTLRTVFNASDKTDRILGDVSYDLYLFQTFQEILTNAFVVPAHGFVNKLLLVSVLSVFTFGGSFLIWAYFDGPINRWRHRWVQSRMTRTA